MLTKDKVLKGRYRVIDQLGRSGKSAVYEAYDSIRKANVALKEILIDSEKVPAINERENLKRAFADRAKILAEVKHESLPQIRGYFSEFDRQYLVIELINGDDAGELLAKNEKPIAFASAANWADQLLDALDYLHTLPVPIVHGDVSPPNIKLNSRGRIKLLGFDITESAEAKTKTLVSTRIVAECSPFLSPEQFLQLTDSKSRQEFAANYKGKSDKFLRQPVDERSDIYALGATLYYLVTGQTPLDAMKRTSAIWADQHDPLPAAHDVNSSVPAELSDVLTKALAIEPENRFVSAVEMRQSLQTANTQTQAHQTEAAVKRESAKARETLLAEEKRLETERRTVEQERQRIEKEREKQAQLIEQQLKIAEAERTKAEQRAAEAKKQLEEKQTPNAAELPISAIIEPSASITVQKSLDADAPSITDNRGHSSKQSVELFTGIARREKPSWLMPAVGALILLIGGATAGIWALRSPENVAAESNQPTVAQPLIPQTASPTIQIAPLTEAAPSPVSETVSAPTTATTPPAPLPSAEKTVGQSASKTKIAAAAPPRIVKPPAAKAPTVQKKAVTVDDLIGN